MSSPTWQKQGVEAPDAIMAATGRRTHAAFSRRTFLAGCLSLGAMMALGPLYGCATDRAQADDAHANGEDAERERVGSGSGEEPLTRTFFAFDTVITLTAYSDESLLDDLEERCEYFEKRFSRTLEGSDVQRINDAHGAPTEVAPETADLIRRALEYCDASGGLFDITIGAVTSLWDFKAGIRPADAEIIEALTHVDWRGVHVDGCTVTLDDPSAMLDLGGIAKGYIADDLTRLISEAGCASAIVNLGGNVAVVGGKPDGSPWKVGIQDPNAATNAKVIAAVEATDTSVVTSGLYERCFEEDGVRYHHILDPRTGYPAETDLLSSSIVCESSTSADALATWLFLAGAEDALAYLENEAGLEGLVVRDDDSVAVTSGADFELR